MDRISRKETSFICSVIKEGMLNAWNCEMNKSTRKRTRASSSNTRAFLKCWVRVCARVPVCVCVQDTYRWNTIPKLRSSPGVLHPWTGITGFTWKANDQMSMICMRERALTHTHVHVPASTSLLFSQGKSSKQPHYGEKEEKVGSDEASCAETPWKQNLLTLWRFSQHLILKVKNWHQN